MACYLASLEGVLQRGIQSSELSICHVAGISMMCIHKYTVLPSLFSASWSLRIDWFYVRRQFPGLEIHNLGCCRGCSRSGGCHCQ